MEKALQYETRNNRSYRHFKVTPGVVAQSNKKLEFFYIGKTAGVIDKLVKSFESGYAAESPEQARTMLQRLAINLSAIPDVIIADGSIGKTSLSVFAQFLLSNDKLVRVPFLIEGTVLTAAELEGFGKESIADDIISIEELGKERLVGKVKFWKKIKEGISQEQPPVTYDFAPVASAAAGFSKRTFDIVISALLMVILSPLFLLIVIALKIESKGPVFYISKRAGRGYKIFNFYKFRTMEAEANTRISDVSHLNLYNPLMPNGPVFIKIDNDPRITKLGALLRKCSLDELPQLLNVFLGDMSLVGNRPLPLYEAASLTTDEWATRFLAPAGMTGLWQIKKREKFKMTAEERIMLDINYAEKSNLLFDLWIMAKTPSAVIQRTNA